MRRVVHVPESRIGHWSTQEGLAPVTYACIQARIYCGMSSPLPNETAAEPAYDRWASRYDGDVNATRDLDAYVARHAPLRVTGSDVVEFGCGTGKNTEWLASHARRVVALDFSAGMLDVARRRVSSDNTQFIQHDVRHPWPVDNRSADVVIGNLVLEHVERLDAVLAEAARVVRPGGQLFLCELHPFKQLVGGQARFIDPDTGALVRVEAFRHSVSEYVNTGLAAGFTLRALGEWPDADALPDASPRLLSLLFDLPDS